MDSLTAPPTPEATSYIVGDVHGRIDLLETLVARIDENMLAAGDSDPQLVFVGDYVDRGDHSAEVLVRLQELSIDLPNNVTCLMGNHEAMMLSFLDNPLTKGPRWLRHGGLQTLASFRVGLAGGEEPSGDELVSAAATLRQHLGGALDWLRARPLSWRSGNLWAVHAAADPACEMTGQERSTLLWGHPDFGRTARKDGQWIVHGHAVVDWPRAAEGIVSVDTGAYYSGRLSAVAVRPDGSIEFITTD